MAFKERLRASMERKGWDQKALALAANLSESAISRHLERDDAPRADSLKKYADALGVEVAWLGFGRTEPAPTTPAAGAQGPDAVGAAALALVLRDYAWPSNVDMMAIDSAEADARAAALTPAGQTRSPSAWRAYLDRLVKRGSEPRTRHRRVG